MRSFVMGSFLCVSASTAIGGGIQTLDDVTVEARQTDLIGLANSASEGTVLREQLLSRPLLRPAEVLEAVPGLIVSQHSGSGKANQYYLRGLIWTTALILRPP